MKKYVLCLIAVIMAAGCFLPLSFAEVSKYTSVDKKSMEEMKPGTELENKGDYAGALVIYRQVAQKHPDSQVGVLAMYSILDAYDKMGDIDGTLKTLHEMVAKYEDGPFDKDAQTAKMGIDLYKPVKLENEGKYDEAIKSYREIEKKYVADKDISAWAKDAAKALQYYMDGKKEKALEIYRFHLEHTGGIPFESWEKRGIARCS